MIYFKQKFCLLISSFKFQILVEQIMVVVHIYVYYQQTNRIHVHVLNTFHLLVIAIIELVYQIVVVINIVVVHLMNDAFHGQQNVMELLIVRMDLMSQVPAHNDDV